MMDSARFRRVHRIDVIEGDVRVVADLQIGKVPAQAQIIIPYDNEHTARIMGAFMIQAVHEEYEERLRAASAQQCARLLKEALKNA